MKFTTLECLTREDYLAALGARIESSHKISKSGGRRGGNITVARKYGILPQVLANVLNGYGKPAKKMLDHDGLEAVTVYVRKNSESL